MLNLQNIKDAKKNLLQCNTEVFDNIGNSFKYFLNKIEVINFRHIQNLSIEFNHPVTVLTGTNKIGKTSILLLIACSHHKFMKYDSTKPDTTLRSHTWGDVFSFTNYENTARNYSYKLFWRFCHDNKEGEGKRLSTSKAWTGLGKYSADDRQNAKIKDREVRLIDLERLLPARNFSSSLYRKIAMESSIRLTQDIEKAFAYILDIPTEVQLHKIGSHINKLAYLINYMNEPYSSYNAASGEESLINILVDVFETPANSLILIDEIEAGFHPAIQRKLADVIQYVAWNSKKQFILTTHSPSLLSAFPQKSRKFIDIKFDNSYEVINDIPVNAAFSKMDSIAYPLVTLYCEDTEAEFIIKNLLVDLSISKKYFNRLVNVIKSGPADQVKNDYERHKHNYSQMRFKLGYCCVFDGDYHNDSKYSQYLTQEEFSLFLYPHIAPEKFLVKSYLDISPNPLLQTALTHDDHHSLFSKMVSIGLAVDVNQAKQECWNAFKRSSDYEILKDNFQQFILKTIQSFSERSD